MFVEWSQVLNLVQEKHKEFNRNVDQQKAQISIRKRQSLDNLEILKGLPWSNLLDEYRLEILACQNDFRALDKFLTDIKTEEWLNDAEKKCGSVSGRIDLIEKRVQDSLRNAQIISREVSRRYNAVQFTIDPLYRGDIMKMIDSRIKNAKSANEVFDLIDRAKNKQWQALVIGNIINSNVNIDGDNVVQNNSYKE